MKRTALLSAYDKTGVVDFARELHGLGFDILASGGTAKVIAGNDIPVKDVAEIVGEPILGHRVVTLSREIHAALLATESEEDCAELARLGIPRIDLVYVNLYPLKEEIHSPNRTLQSVIYKTDIGGPTMLRSAAKGRRIVLASRLYFNWVLDLIASNNFMSGGKIPDECLCQMAGEAEQVVSEYCTLSASYQKEVAYMIVLKSIKSWVVGFPKE